MTHGKYPVGFFVVAHLGQDNQQLQAPTFKL